MLSHANLMHVHRLLKASLKHFKDAFIFYKKNKIAIILPYSFFIISLMMKHVCVIFLITISIFIFSFFIISSSSVKTTWLSNDSYTFYESGNLKLKCSEELSVFVDFDNTINIYDAIGKKHYSTKSRTRFISILSKICSENYYDHIAVLMLCSGYNKQAVIFEILQDETLVQTVSYEEKDNTVIATVKPVEIPCPHLRFIFSLDYMYCTCPGN